METYLKTPQTIGQTLDNAVWLFRGNWTSLLPLSIFYALLLTSPRYLLTYAPVSLTSMLHQYQYHYLGVTAYLVLVTASAMIYKTSLNAHQKQVGCAEAFSISVRKSLLTVIVLFIMLAVSGGLYWAIDEFIGLNLSYDLSKIPQFGNYAVNLLGVTVASCIAVYLTPAIGIVLVKHVGPIAAIKQSLSWTYGQCNRTAMIVSMAKLLSIVGGLTFVLLLTIANSLLSFGEQYAVYQLIAQAMGMILLVGFGFTVYSLLLIDLELRYHLKHFMQK